MIWLIIKSKRKSEDRMSKTHYLTRLKTETVFIKKITQVPVVDKKLDQ